MRLARKFVLGEGTCYYHVMSRVVDRQFIFGDLEKQHFRKLMRRLQDFTGLKVLTYALMSNHFHLLLEVPAKRAIHDGELSKRIEALHGIYAATSFMQELHRLEKDGHSEHARSRRLKMMDRMHDLSWFMKELKGRFSHWYNRRMGRKGTLWEERYKCLLVEGAGESLLTMAIYIDLNAVRAGLCQDPRHYRFCGCGEAMGGNMTARNGLVRLLEVAGRSAGGENWRTVRDRYCLLLIGIVDQEAGVLTQGSSRQNLLRKLHTGGKLTLYELLQCRVRYLTDGVVLGSKAFVEDFFHKKRRYFGQKRKSGPRRMKGGDWSGLYTIRDFQVRVFG